jgi:hypothetical protein
VLCLATLLERIESTEHHLREQRLPTFSNATAFLPDAGPSLLKKSNSALSGDANRRNALMLVMFRAVRGGFWG